MFKRFAKDDEAGITAFVLIMFFVLIVGGGMGIDFMRHESERSALQDALDRGVLAAASFDFEESGVDVDTRVTSFLRASEFLESRNPVLNVTSDFDLYSRTVSVTGQYEVDTFFLKLIGMDTLPVTAASSATTSRGKVEISLVLDNSGSMGGEKIRALRSAANNFIDLVLNDETKEDTSISIVPFTAQVNAGATLASQYNLRVWHNYSYCFNFRSSDYDGTSLSTSRSFTQEQHFQRSSNTPECPRSEIVPLSNDSGVLHASIDAMRAGGYTSTYSGMKWGAALLDPDSRDVIAALPQAPLDADVTPANPVLAGMIDRDFSGVRPIDWTDEYGLKFIVLMTDGANTRHKKIRSGRNSHPVHYYNHYNTADWRTQENADYWDANRCNSSNDCKMSTIVTGSTGDNRLQRICDAAKEDVNVNGTTRDRIIIFTIGFNVDVGSNPYNMMRQCASSESKFYHIQGTDVSSLNTAFVQIASSIAKLRLTD